MSWIHDRGFTGISYTNRQDKYGLPGHSHEYESCHPHGLKLHCGSHDDHDHENHTAEEGHDHDHEHAHAHAHDHAGPWVNLKSERYDFRTELNDPFLVLANYVHKPVIPITNMMKSKKERPQPLSKAKVMMHV